MSKRERECVCERERVKERGFLRRKASMDGFGGAQRKRKGKRKRKSFEQERERVNAQPNNNINKIPTFIFAKL